MESGEGDIRGDLLRAKQYIEKLRRLSGRGEFLERMEVKYFAERLIQQAIESLLDVGVKITEEKCSKRPKGYGDVFSVLEEKGLIPKEKAEKYAAIVNFRDQLVSQPTGVERERLYRVFRMGVGALEEMYETYLEILGSET
ncbi:MAG: DUF86 domain-containing protein [Nitrososphaeria archaeon]|nr:DUF86 domain-containing protein [Nitrososphaeria archaeon]NIN52320.1 DUF86 domain-containing protein [Nitrososphaeria archaeon]NIQ32798.1 DUF86 domain-containing protein [Nitrososphaeria archaeon]